MKTVKSYGLVMYNDKNILLIKKRITYSFIEFVNGKYDFSNLLNLFKGMTSQEKLIILTCNFKFIWYHCNLHMQNNKYYKKAKIKFDLLQRSKMIENIKLLINKSENRELIWELPKGRPRKGELYINTAIREFYEETNIKNDNYRILFELEPIVYSFIDEGVNYIYYYYSAVMNNTNFKPSLNYNASNMIFEISDIKFIPFSDLSHYLKDKYFINKIKDNYKLVNRLSF